MSSDFPKRLGEKLKTIRLRLAMTPDEIAQFVGANDAAEIIAYEDDEGVCLYPCCGAMRDSQEIR